MASRLMPIAIAVGLACAGAAPAQVASDQPGSMLIFPKVIADGTRDTIIQISNVGNAEAHGRCWYVNGAPVDPGLPPHPVFNPPSWLSTDFELHLTAEQPTVWVVSRGRLVDPSDAPCSRANDDYDCYGAGFDPGAIPPIPAPFTGELRCVETDVGGSPLSGNHLTGGATLADAVSGDVSRYNAIGFAGLPENDGTNLLILGEEYAACPAAQRFIHAADGIEVAAVGPGSGTATELTIVPCTANFDTNAPESETVVLVTTNEFEQPFSFLAVADCWANIALGGIGLTFETLGTRTAQTVLRPSASSGGIVAVAEERRTASGGSTALASAAVDLHVEGARAASDFVVLD